MLSQTATTVSPEVIDQFRNWLSVRGKSNSTCRGYTSDLKTLLMELEVTELDQEEFEECGMNWLQANRRRVSPKTTNRRLTSLKAFSKWAGWGNLFDDYSAPVPAKALPHPLPEGIEGVYRLIEIAHQENHKALVALCGLCGCRVAEALSIRHSDFDLQTMMLHIRGKGDKGRWVPVSARAWDILVIPVTRSFIEGDRPIVGLKDRFARQIISDLGERAGLRRHISSHDLRSTFATEIYNRTLDLRLVQELLGHSSSTTTELYTGVNQAKMREAVEL